jgi:hypothetical protein
MYERNAPATKSCVEDLRQELAAFRVEFHARFDLFEHRIEQYFSEAESRIVTAINRLAESMRSA